MSDIAELERRITAALERIGQSVERGFAAGAVPPTGAAVDAEREAVLAEALSERDAARAESVELQAQVTRLTRQVDAYGLDLQRMRKTVIQLRETLRSLREAQTAAQPDGGVIHSALIAELEALRSERLADLIEMEAIIAELKPLTAEVQNG